jgi:hypothetical protein
LQRFLCVFSVAPRAAKGMALGLAPIASYKQLQMWMTERTLQIAFDGMLVVVTIALAVIAARQEDMARKSARRARQAVALAEKANNQATKSFATAQHAAVYFGLPDGKVGEFLKSTTGDQVVLHLRNYGASVAQNTIVEFWPVVLTLGQPAILKIPPFYKFSEVGPHPAGFPVPPGFLFTSARQITKEEKRLIKYADATLMIVGRISYIDQFGKYCQPFSVDYGSTTGFELARDPSQPLCDGNPHEVQGYRVEVGRKPTRVWPPPTGVQPTIIEGR